MEELVKEFEAGGGKYQLLMFLTGPAGAGKSTSMKVAQRFGLEFSHAVGMMWNVSTFLFIAYTGSAAMEVGGLTIYKTDFLLKRTVLTDEDKRM